MRYQAALFDFDYTLGDATASIYEGFRYGFEQMGYPIPAVETVRGTVGRLLEDAFTDLTGETDPVKRAEFYRLFVSHVEHIQAETTVLLPGAEDLLRFLHENGVKLGVVSSKRSAILKETLRAKGVLELFDYVVGGEQVKEPKPHPQGLNEGIAALGVDKSRVLYCGDTTIDAGTAQNAGVDFCAVLCGTTPAPAFDAFPYVHIAPDLMDLKNWLEG